MDIAWSIPLHVVPHILRQYFSLYDYCFHVLSFIQLKQWHVLFSVVAVLVSYFSPSVVYVWNVNSLYNCLLNWSQVACFPFEITHSTGTLIHKILRYLHIHTFVQNDSLLKQKQPNIINFDKCQSIFGKVTYIYIYS